jgi:carboxyl-terminal processing protease
MENLASVKLKLKESMGLRLFIVFVLMLASFCAGLWSGKSTCPPQPAEGADLTMFWKTWHTLEDKFVDRGKIVPQKMVYGAIQGMVAALDDPYTSFFDPEDSKQFLEDTNGSFEGVGMEIGIKKGQLQVVSPIENSPAQKAGLKAGDLIVRIGDKSTADMTTDEAVDLIRGPKGSEVTLSMYREEWQETRDIKLTRDVINVPSIKIKIRDDGIAYVQLYQFTEKAGDDFRAAAVDIINSGVKGIVLDVRNNPGGYLHVAQEIGGWFLDKGQVVTHEDSGDEREKQDYLSEGPSLLSKYPIVVLINGGSASASEILAGALRDNRGVKLVGTKSFGKGSVQQLVQFGDGSSLKVTIAKWLTPKGDQISEVGLTPDYEVKITPEDETAGKDPQLEKAIEIVKQLQ